MNKLTFCIVAAAALGGCASVGGDALVDTVALPATPTGCAAPAAADRELCAAIAATHTSATNYRSAAQELDDANVAYGLLQTASAIAILGFGLFDAHPDNISAATLSGAIATGMRQGVHPDRQRDILVDGVRGMTCVARRGAVFIGHYQTGQRLRTQADFNRHDVATARDAARAAADRTAAESVTAAADELEQAINEAMQVVRYRTGAALQVQEGHAVVETSVFTQLRAERPNYAAIIEAIRAAATPAAPEGGAGEATSDTTRSLADWANYLRQQARTLRADTANGPGKAEFDAIMNCVGRT